MSESNAPSHRPGDGASQEDDEPIELPTGIAGRGFFGTGTAGFALVASLVPFFASASHTETVNGRVVSHIDYVAVVAGGLALVLGIVGLADGLRKKSSPTRVRLLGLAGLAALVASYQLVSGLGLLV